MEKRDIIILAALLAVAGLNLYRRYAKKKDAGNFGAKKTGEKSSLSVQPDDYEPYSGKNQGK